MKIFKPLVSSPVFTMFMMPLLICAVPFASAAKIDDAIRAGKILQIKNVIIPYSNTAGVLHELTVSLVRPENTALIPMALERGTVPHPFMNTTSLSSILALVVMRDASEPMNGQLPPFTRFTATDEEKVEQHGLTDEQAYNLSFYIAKRPGAIFQVIAMGDRLFAQIFSSNQEYWRETANELKDFNFPAVMRPVAQPE